MRGFRLLLMAGLLGAAFAAQAQSVTYKLDPNHTMVLFSWDHLGFSHPTADIGLGEGTITFDPQNPAAASVQVTLPMSKLDTHVKALDDHLKQADFFDAAKYPVVTFKSTKVVPVDANHFKVTGDLTVHGVTKPVTLDATLNKIGHDPMSQAPAIGFDATATLSRTAFGVGAMVPMVGDEISVRITTQGSEPKAK